MCVLACASWAQTASYSYVNTDPENKAVDAVMVNHYEMGLQTCDIDPGMPGLTNTSIPQSMSGFGGWHKEWLPTIHIYFRFTGEFDENGEAPYEYGLHNTVTGTNTVIETGTMTRA
jgi:hypothetical protein